ncbi:ribosome biogenesis GTP-binding protein YihA/YsxC [Desulfobotulus mexicanus]|uniref:Probable GTP-binding protein EngB n=1 Tax=Desulfobotulus mexicanus TaxID=2586642 RepID=A0A5Q4VGL2_9BACT|nr:ribosome biogenesis GTP-binding protein YihA/YsxC [Desulfobotulus mexicanus]TYT76006.1 YihA family ribosome biogenesis GTP-binding protein [Desulfobotulus mexicanus]
MHIKSAEFITSAVKSSQYPPPDLPEVAFVGRSNVGKSSMINCLVQRKSLVKTSQTPGKTQLVNFFLVNGCMRFVDLPGYGYAKVPKSVQQQWGPMIETYISQRPNLCGLFLLMDIRRDAREEEGQILQWLMEKKLPVRLVLTKADKFSRSAAQNRFKILLEQTGLEKDDLLLFSSVTRQGRDEVWSLVSSMTGIYDTSV